MQPQAATPSWAQTCCALIVGIDPSSGSIQRVYLWPDGRMASADRLHRLRPGMAAWREAETVFGLSFASVFRADEDGLRHAALYGCTLQRKLATGIPLGLVS